MVPSYLCPCGCAAGAQWIHYLPTGKGISVMIIYWHFTNVSVLCIKRQIRAGLFSCTKVTYHLNDTRFLPLLWACKNQAIVDLFLLSARFMNTFLYFEYFRSSSSHNSIVRYLYCAPTHYAILFLGCRSY